MVVKVVLVTQISSLRLLHLNAKVSHQWKNMREDNLGKRKHRNQGNNARGGCSSLLASSTGINGLILTCVKPQDELQKHQFSTLRVSRQPSQSYYVTRSVLRITVGEKKTTSPYYILYQSHEMLGRPQELYLANVVSGVSLKE